LLRGSETTRSANFRPEQVQQKRLLRVTSATFCEPLPHRHQNQNNARTLLDRRAIEIWCGERKIATIQPDV
jgi:hypothetical protein